MSGVEIKGIKFPSLGVTESNPFSVNSTLCEQLISDQTREMPLQDIQQAKDPEMRTRFWELDRHFLFEPNALRDNGVFDTILERFSDKREPCAMKVKDFADLEEKVWLTYLVSHEHYAQFKKADLHFPEKDCGYSASNMLFTLIDMGFINATYLDSSLGHAYVALPFVMETSGEQGFIVNDPTSDQLWKNIPGPRNHTFVVFEDSFEYFTDFILEEKKHPHSVHFSELIADGRNLFPTNVVNWGLVNDSIAGWFDYIYPKLSDTFEEGEDVPEAILYFREAFKNPVKVDVCPVD
jgi:hypothetical protein